VFLLAFGKGSYVSANNPSQDDRDQAGYLPHERHGDREMEITLIPSTEVPVVVWRNDGMFYARQTDAVNEPQICLAIDLFEVIAELTGLDLEKSSQSAEAVALAERAQRELA
jgi:hypothetical protein